MRSPVPEAGPAPDGLPTPVALVFDPASGSPAGRPHFARYLLLCLAVASGFSLVTAALWSDIGCGQGCLEFLQGLQGLVVYALAAVFALLLALYMLDFFSPPHLPGMYFVLYDGDRVAGRCLLLVAAVGLVAAGFLSARSYPTLPLGITIFLSPASFVVLKRVALPRASSARARPNGQEERMMLLTRLIEEEAEEKSFYVAATCAFGLVGNLCLLIWVPWAISDNARFQAEIARIRDHDAKQLLFVRWAVPLILAFSNFVFASFTGLRVMLHQAYVATDQFKNGLVLGTRSFESWNIASYRISRIQTRLAGGAAPSQDVLMTTQDRMQQQLVRHIACMRHLSQIVKFVGCAFIALIGGLYIAFELTVADSHVAFLVQGFCVAFFLTFVSFVYISFERLGKTMAVWVMDLPLWRSVTHICQMDWARALTLCLLLPLGPILLLLSFANQLVRRCRGLCDTGSCLTARVQSVLDGMRCWNWLSVVTWTYAVAAVVIIYKISPIFLNVLLSWMTSIVRGLSFGLILASTFALGMVLFMLPPVPGPPIYLFGGIVIADASPLGFWWGSVICILLCFALKLTACAVQQKVIGEWLGSSQRVRRSVGVHKPFIRAIEAVLRRPGLSFGKCMILCGGPDWPVSVLAGILRLSVWQCLLGTLPIIASLVPLALTGSFYLKRAESEVWTRAGNLMLALTVLVSVTFWAGMGWAVQDEYDKHYGDLIRPKEEYIELEWLDHRASCIRERCVLTWADLPCCIQAFFFAGAAGLVLVSNLFLWRSGLCFGSVRVTDDIGDLRWFGGGGLLQLPGIVGLAVAAASYACLTVYVCWHGRLTAKLGEAAAQDVDLGESAWKNQRRAAALEETGSPDTSRAPAPAAPRDPESQGQAGVADPAAAHRRGAGSEHRASTGSDLYCRSVGSVGSDLSSGAGTLTL